MSAESTFPDDFKGVNARARLAELEEDETSEQEVLQTFTIMYEIGNYFNNKYPNNEIFEDGFYENLRPFFPNDTDEELIRYTNYLRNGIRIYRIGKTIYNKYVAEKLMPKAYRVVHSDDDFDKKDEVKYIEAEKGKFVKVYNFKKFLTYSNNDEERKAIDKYINFKHKDNNAIAKFEYIMNNYSWKELFKYGKDNPLVSNLGIGENIAGNHLDIQLLSASSYLENQKQFYIGVHILTKDNYFVLANNLSPMQKKPIITFENSVNLEKYEIKYPVPLSTISLPYVHKYFGDFIIPVAITVKDTEKALQLNSQVNLTVCNNYMNCLTQDFELQLTIKPHGVIILNNGWQNFFNKSIQLLPDEQTKDLKLQKFVTDEDENGQSLRLEFKSAQSVKNFKVFIEEQYGYTKFSAPIISIQDNKIYVRFQPMKGENISDFKNSIFQITAILNNEVYYRTEQAPNEAALFDTQSNTLNLGLILIAILGGLILNFMPCVFPVLSLKIISLSRAGSVRRKNIKKSLFLTCAGIFCGFSVLIIALLAAKYLGYSLGWGMQYQNMNFLIGMTFVLTAITIFFPQLQTSNLINISSKLDYKFNFILGNLIVLLSTPCTGPYLATAIGFALSGSYFDIVVILYSVALGLSLPYLVAVCFKNPETLLPTPGAWLQKLSSLMKIMMYLTIGWFLILIYNQTDFICVGLLVLLLLFFIAMFKLYRLFIEYLDGVFEENISIETINKLRKISTYSIVAIFIICLFSTSFLAQSSYKRHLDENLEKRLTFIDKSLIAKKLSQGHPVLLEIGADWCLTCRYNTTITLNSSNLAHWNKTYMLDFIQVDWTNYNKEVLDFMEKYGRKGLPFYILYTPLMRDGMVLPEVLSGTDFENILRQATSR